MSDKLSDEQIEAAKAAGFSWHPIRKCLVAKHSSGAWVKLDDKLARFAALLAASPAPAIPAVDREAIIERCAQVCEMERAAFRANEAVWNANPAMRPDDEYIADWESSACRGEEYAARIRALKAAPAISESEDARDAARYRLLRRGQRWSVINGIGDTLRAEELDAVIDATRDGGGS